MAKNETIIYTNSLTAKATKEKHKLSAMECVRKMMKHPDHQKNKIFHNRMNRLQNRIKNSEIDETEAVIEILKVYNYKSCEVLLGEGVASKKKGG